MPAGFSYPHHLPHKLQGLFSKVYAFLGVGMPEDSDQAGDGPVYVHISVRAPDYALALLIKSALLRATVLLIPHGDPASDPARPLHSVR